VQERPANLSLFAPERGALADAADYLPNPVHDLPPEARAAMNRGYVQSGLFILGGAVGRVAGWAMARLGLAAEGAGLLAQSEAAGGHLIARHVGLEAAALDARIAAGNINVASSFRTLAEAEAAAGAALSSNASAVSAWVQAGATGRLAVTGPFSGGLVRVAGGYSAEATGARFVLQGNGAGGYHILTGFPVP